MLWLVRETAWWRENQATAKKLEFTEKYFMSRERNEKDVACAAARVFKFILMLACLVTVLLPQLFRKTPEVNGGWICSSYKEFLKLYKINTKNLRTYLKSSFIWECPFVVGQTKPVFQIPFWHRSWNLCEVVRWKGVHMNKVLHSPNSLINSSAYIQQQLVYLKSYGASVWRYLRALRNLIFIWKSISHEGVTKKHLPRQRSEYTQHLCLMPIVVTSAANRQCMTNRH